MILINLLPHREQRRRASIITLTKWAIVTGALGAGVVVLLLIYLAGAVTEKIAYNDAIENKIKEFDQNIKEIETIRGEIKSLEGRIAAVEQLQSSRNNSVIFFRELAKLTPDGVRINLASQEGNLLLINGIASSQDLISKFIGALSNSTGWYGTPELIEIRTVQVNLIPKKQETVYAFGIRAARNNK